MDFTFAFDTILIFVFIIVPGIAFRRFYFQGEFTKQYNSRTLSHSILASILPGLIIQFISLFWYSKYSDVSQMVQSFTAILNDLKTGSANQLLFDFNFIFSIILYVCMMFFVSISISLLCWKFVRLTGVDRKNKLFRFRNNWNYYLRGELEGFKEYENLFKDKETLRVYADVLVRIENEEPRLYSGLLSQYTIDNNHELKYIYLTGTSIYKKDNSFGDEKGNSKRKKKRISGDIMIISAADVININLKYIKADLVGVIDKNFNVIKKSINLLTLLVILIMIFGGFEYMTSHTIYSAIGLHLYIIVIIMFFSALLRNIFDFKNVNRKPLIFSKVIILIILLIVYSVFKYVVNIF